ncbi:ribbon-helix-helix domain-containing protein [Mycobacterium sp. KBS0706]|jgi:predicted DNA-binding ribbon-helix-helix protein|uniref:ribbon-helix-helix domain-containing protein n=1 Tax=Mycobacterium sp. KBS0706 TaxID=2578109 RepID=UPI00110F9051|nr:ribbon-helix-helix domain-containing protein [Mycobacterium sp. KBS0706]TSD86787.1 ribbon-helix-helix domain-containing protein [Mycobacterium sp. KBS0706]
MKSNDNRDRAIYLQPDRSVPASRTRNVTVGGARSSIRLEEAFWDALEEILRREGLTLNELVSRIWGRLPANGNLSSAARVFVHSYFYTLSQNGKPLLPSQSDWKIRNLHN